MSVSLRPADVDRLVDMIGRQAADSMIGPQKRLKQIVDGAHLPTTWSGQLAGVWTGDPYYDTRQLIKWANSRGLNPADKRYTTLGSILAATLEQFGLEERAAVAATILVYDLFADRRMREDLRFRYSVPESPKVLGEVWKAQQDAGVWSDEEGELDLQSWLRAEPPLLDVAFLARAIQRSSAICRVETPDGQGVGTGFLVGPSHAMTNQHVLEGFPGQTPIDPAEVVLRFGFTEDAEGQAIKLAPDAPVTCSSPVRELDYALLELESPLVDRDPLPYSDGGAIAKGDGLNILQHPQGGAMKVAITGNGVCGVQPAKGFLHYVTTTAGGSSGSPCFDQEWRLVAIHHGERSRPWGAVREGVLLAAIYPEFARFL